MTKGMLIVTANPPAFMEEEFNAWYDQEHLPERLTVPGFESGRRYVMMGMERRYIALYDLTEIGVLNTPAYQAISNDRPSPWSKRVVGRCRFQRFATEQIFAGGQARGASARLLVVQLDAADGDAADAIVAGAERHFGGRGNELRVFMSDDAKNPRFFIVVGSDGHVPEELEAGSFAPARVTSIATYAPY